MVDSQPSNMDDLFDFAVPGSATEPQSAAPQFASRRELREAAASSGKAVSRAAAPAARPEPSAHVAKPAKVSRAERKALARQTQSLEGSAAPAARKLGRSEVAALRASGAKQPRKNPLSVLLTMTAVGGMFAVAGLPAYALTTPETTLVAQATDVTTQSLTVGSTVTAQTAARDGYTATTPEQLAQQSKDALRAAANAAYLASGARGMGDDYPWPYELMDDQGGGLSPLNYYYRECVDFVAWRLNRDAGYYAAPFKWVWSNLTPTGGNGGQWMYAWQQHGWPVSKTPVVGSVAYTGGNHVAYVKSVNSDGTVTLEEYNYIPGAYGQRTISAASVVAFLYPPPG